LEEEKYDELRIEIEKEDIFAGNYIYLVPQNKDKSNTSRDNIMDLNNSGTLTKQVKRLMKSDR